ncbi:MAG: GGDEF domain-containing protein [Rhodospirillales bacterium]|nr:GGDEF domain-containing protein [Rhodospirillales bacterium]
MTEIAPSPSATWIGNALHALRKAAELEGVAVLEASGPEGELRILYEAGLGGVEIMPTADAMLQRQVRGRSHQRGADRRPVMIYPWELTPGRPGALALWRMPGTRAWETRDHTLAASAGCLLYHMLAHAPAENGIDRLTGLPNRPYFLAEVDRHIERLQADGLPGTIVQVDFDELHRITDIYGRAAGDWVLTRTAFLLRAMVRPGDLVARVGTDAFALWLAGMDHLTAAERAESLQERRLMLPETFTAGAPVRQTFSIGIAAREFGIEETADQLLQRAAAAALEVRRGGGSGWRVAASSHE